MATRSANFAELLETRNKEIFFKNFMMQPQRYRQLFSVKKSTTAHEDRMRVAGLGSFQPKPEGAPIAFTDPVQGTRYRVVHQFFALGYRVTKEAMDDDQWGIIRQMPADLGDSAADHQERLAWDLLNDGYTGARHTGLDNLSLFNSAHTSLRPEVAAQSNILSPPVELSITGLETMMTLAETTQSDEGRYINMEQSILLIHPEESHNAYVLLNTDKRVGSSDNDVSTVTSSRTGLRPLAVPYLTATKAWSIHAGVGKNSLQWNNRESLFFARANDSDTFDEKHIGAYRASVQFSEWRGNWGSNFS